MKVRLHRYPSGRGFDLNWLGLSISWYHDNEYIQLKIGYLR